MSASSSARKKKTSKQRPEISSLEKKEIQADVFSADEEAELEQVDAKADALAARLESLRAKARLLERDLRLQERANKSMGFELEKQRLMRVSIWFYILLVPTLLCTFGSYTKGNYVWASLNGLSFLLVWRSLYARQNSVWFVVAGAVCAWTLWR